MLVQAPLQVLLCKAAFRFLKFYYLFIYCLLVLALSIFRVIPSGYVYDNYRQTRLIDPFKWTDSLELQP